MRTREKEERILQALENIAESLKEIEKRMREEEAQEETGNGREIGFRAQKNDAGENLRNRPGTRDGRRIGGEV